VGLTATAIEVVAPATLAVPVVQTPAASALPPTLKVVPASGNWLVNAIVWAASARFAQKIAQVPEQSATSTRSIAILLIAATAVPALYAVTSGPFIASVRMS
jgi:mRNA-degrading endonuclease toxin of MazEF toxin-antitoxin module